MHAPSADDIVQIQQLYARYSWALDTGDTEAYLALFTEDAEATEETSGGDIEVRVDLAEIRKLVRKFHDRPDFPGYQHHWSVGQCQSGRNPAPIHRRRAGGGRSYRTPSVHAAKFG